MAFTVKKSTLAATLGLSTTMLLFGCSSDQHYKRQINDDDSYLKAAALNELHVPAGMILPLQNGDYDIPAVSSSGPTGKDLDIRPPNQPLALLNGSRAQFSGNTGILIMDGNSNLWPQIVKAVQNNPFPIAQQQDASQTLTTGWVQWNRADEDNQYRGRYQISIQPQGYQQALTVRLLELQQSGRKVTAPLQIQRYIAQMLNSLSSGLDKAQGARAGATANRSATQLDVQSGADDTGLPTLVVRAPFNTVWQRLPAALKRIGMTVKDSDRSQGSLKVTYQAPDSSSRAAPGAKNPTLANGDYRIQVGDLDNRSSLQLLDPKGQALTRLQNDALVPVFQAAFSR